MDYIKKNNNNSMFYNLCIRTEIISFSELKATCAFLATMLRKIVTLLSQSESLKH